MRFRIPVVGVRLEGVAHERIFESVNDGYVNSGDFIQGNHNIPSEEDVVFDMIVRAPAKGVAMRRGRRYAALNYNTIPRNTEFVAVQEIKHGAVANVYNVAVGVRV